MPSLLSKEELPDALNEIDKSIPLVSTNQISVYERCAWAWEFRYVQGWNPVSTNDSAETGLLCHKFMQVAYAKKIREPSTSVEELVKTIQATGLALPYTTYDQLNQVKRAIQVCRKYFEMGVYRLWDQRKLTVAVEKHFVVLLFTPTGKPYYLQGYIDLLQLLPDRTYIIEDWKSTEQKQRFYSDKAVAMDLQLRCYALGLQHLGFNCYDTAIRNLNTYDYKDFEAKTIADLFARKTATYSKKEMEVFEEEIGLVVDEMFYSGPRRYRRSVSRECSSCWVQEPCILELKGMDTTMLLNSSKFTRKELTGTNIDLVIGVDRKQGVGYT